MTDRGPSLTPAVGSTLLQSILSIARAWAALRAPCCCPAAPQTTLHNGRCPSLIFRYYVSVMFWTGSVKWDSYAVYLKNATLFPTDPRLQHYWWRLLVCQRLCRILHSGDLDGLADLSADGVHSYLRPAHDHAASHHGPLWWSKRPCHFSASEWVIEPKTTTNCHVVKIVKIYLIFMYVKTDVVGNLRI